MKIQLLWNHDTDYDIMTVIMKSWQWLWHHDSDYDVMTMIMTSWQRLWCCDIDYGIMEIIMMTCQWLWYNEDNDYDDMTRMIMALWLKRLWHEMIVVSWCHYGDIIIVLSS